MGHRATRKKKDPAIGALNMPLSYSGNQRDALIMATGAAHTVSTIARRSRYRNIRRKHGLSVSISGNGNCYDNSVVESFFKSLKAELVRRRNWQTRPDGKTAHFEDTNGFCNPHHRHAALGWKSPVTFKRKAARCEQLTGPKPPKVQSAAEPASGKQRFQRTGHERHAGQRPAGRVLPACFLQTSLVLLKLRGSSHHRFAAIHHQNLPGHVAGSV